MEKEKLFKFTDKVVESILHKNRVKQVYELQKVIQEIWYDGSTSGQKITTGQFSITDISKDKIWIMKETGKDAGEGSEFSKGFFDNFLSNFFDKYM